MKKKRNLRFLSLICAILIVTGLGVFHACQEDVEPVYFQTPEAVQTVEIVVENFETKANLSDVSAQITYPDTSGETVTLSDGVLLLDITSREDGELLVKFEKNGFIPTETVVIIDRSELPANSDWTYETMAEMVEINSSVTVDPSKDLNVEVEGSEASVKFPAGCTNEVAEITITEVPAGAELAEETHEIQLKEGHVALKSFNFLPENQKFEIPIEITFPIPDESTELLFATLVDGDWETTEVRKNGDGTGTALVSHFSDYILTTVDIWVIEGESLSEPISFVGNCDEELVATIENDFNTDDTQAKDELPENIHISFSVSKTVEAMVGHERTIQGEYTIKTYRNQTKGYSIQIPSLPVVWQTPGQQVCHTGGSGN
ncbi:hypothetical protein [Marinifilum sp.]|uniref:hypothetical protein n=1 Tax=Marinifilum sp. TaxID=2033137 RepID=UPI003BA9E277